MGQSDTAMENPPARLLIGAREIARYVTGDDGKRSERRVRHMIDRGDIPTFRRGKTICAKASEVDAAIERMGAE